MKIGTENLDVAKTIMIIAILLAGAFASHYGVNVTFNWNFDVRLGYVEDALWTNVNSSFYALQKPASLIISQVGSYTCMQNGTRGKLLWYDTDFAKVFQCAIGNASAGQKIFIRDGDYSVSARLNVSTSVIVEGESQYGTALTLGNWVNDTILYVSADNTQIVNLYLDGNKANNNCSSTENDEGAGIVVRNADNVTVRNIFVKDCFSRAITFRIVTFGSIINCIADNCGCEDAYPRYDNIVFNQVDYGIISGCQSYHAYYDGYVIYRCNWVVLRDSLSNDTGRSGLGLDAPSNVPSAHILIDNFKVHTWHGQQGIGIAGGSNVEIRDITISNCKFVQTLALGESAIRVNCVSSAGVVIEKFQIINNYINYSYKHGIWVGGHASHQGTIKDGLIAGNTIEQCMRDGIFIDDGASGEVSDITVTDNIITENNRNNQATYYCGIRVSGGSNITISNNRVRDNHNAEIYADMNCADITIEHNNVLGSDQAIGINATGHTVRYNKGFTTENWGSASISAGTSVQFNHGLAGTADYVFASFNTTGWSSWNWTSTSTQITVQVETSGDYTVYWYAVFEP